MSHQDAATTAQDATFQGRVHISLTDKCTAIWDSASPSDLDVQIAAGVNRGGRRFIKSVAYPVAAGDIDSHSTDAEMDAYVETLWSTTIAYMVGALPEPEPIPEPEPEPEE